MKYTFQIKYENDNGGKSIQNFVTDYESREDAEASLNKFLVYSGLLGSEVTEL